MANFATALVAFILFFSLLGSISPIGEVMVTSVIPGHPADVAGVKPNMIITQINDKQVNSAEEFLLYTHMLEPGSKVTLNVIDDNRERKVINLVTTSDNNTYPGLKVYDVVSGSPAKAAGIKPDMILVRVNNTEIRGLDDFVNFMNSTEPGQKIDVYVLSNNSANASTEVFKNIELTKYPDPNAKKGFLGISYAPDAGAVSYSLGIGIGQFQAKSFLNMLENIPSLLNRVEGWVYLFSLPIFGFTGDGFPGFSGLITYFYEPVGWAAPLGNGIFWILNILMWVGWMNFYVGLFNCLPAVPLDGGQVFRDVMASSLSRIIGDGEKVEKVTNAVVILFAVLILMSLVFVAFAPYAAHGF
jgi:membrane-associated protease RseP (regulator of RpoE activity)